jgi:hypothetical protein
LSSLIGLLLLQHHGRFGTAIKTLAIFAAAMCESAHSQWRIFIGPRMCRGGTRNAGATVTSKEVHPERGSRKTVLRRPAHAGRRKIKS